MATQDYTGSCQCGAVRLSGPLDLAGAMTCNCSRCRRMGWVLVFAPEGALAITDDGATTEFLFNRHTISHRFCTTCGVQLYGTGLAPDGSRMVAVNVNCLDGVDARALPAHHNDGASY